MSEPRFDLLAGGVPEVTLDATAGPVTYQLPAGFASGRRLFVQREDSAASTSATVVVVSGGFLDGTLDGTRVIPRNGRVEFVCKGSDRWESYGGGSSGGSVPEDVEELLDLKLDRDFGNALVVPALTALGIEEGGRRPVGDGPGDVASGDDPRFSDARTPVAHAASHQAGGGDALTLQQSQVSGLPAALTAKADLVSGKVPLSQLPPLAINEWHSAASQAEMLALDAEQGDVVVRTDFDPVQFYWLSAEPAGTLANWDQISLATAGVVSVSGKTGAVTLAIADTTGLQAALDAKASTASLSGYATNTLSNVTATTGRTALGLGNSATRAVGTAAGTVAAGDDSRIVGAATAANLATTTSLAQTAHDLAEDAIPLSYMGAPDGVSELDGAGVIPAARLSGRSYLDFGAAPARHTHGLADLPDAARVLGTSVLVVKFDATTEQWESTRGALVLRPGQVVLWYGNAEPPADADDDDLHLFDAAAVPLPPVEEPEEPTNARDVNGVVLNAPTATVTGQTVNLTALLNTNASKTFTYLQFAVRRTSDNSPADAGHTYNVTINGDYTLTGSRADLGAGNWTAQLAYSLDGSAWFNGPTVGFTVAAPAAPAGLGLINRSGLPWNAGVFYQAGSLTAANSFATWRNRPLDSIMYFTGRDKWDDLLWLRDDLTSWPGYRIICVPFQPQLRNGQGQTNPEGSNNIPTANGSNNARWVTFGQRLKDKGWDDGRTIVRLSWESNGNWYDWGWGNTVQYASASTAISAFTGAWSNVVDSIRTRTTKILFDCNVNRGNTRSGVNFFTDILGPIIDRVDIVGLDWYNHAPAQLSQGEFDSTAAQTYSGNDIHAWCVANSKLLSIDEWFPSRGVAGSYAGGGDDPNWIARMWTWMQAHAYGNGGRMIQEVSYNDPGAPSALMHSLYNPEQNPNAAAAYKSTSRWGRA